MKVEFIRELPIKAMPINNHYLLADKMHEVEKIEMGQFNTDIYIDGIMYNSVHFAFYLNGNKIDIYKSGLLNRYLSLNLPMICYMEG